MIIVCQNKNKCCVARMNDDFAVALIFRYLFSTIFWNLKNFASEILKFCRKFFSGLSCINCYFLSVLRLFLTVRGPSRFKVLENVKILQSFSIKIFCLSVFQTRQFGTWVISFLDLKKCSKMVHFGVKKAPWHKLDFLH